MTSGEITTIVVALFGGGTVKALIDTVLASWKESKAAKKEKTPLMERLENVRRSRAIILEHLGVVRFLAASKGVELPPMPEDPYDPED